MGSVVVSVIVLRWVTVDVTARGVTVTVLWKYSVLVAVCLMIWVSEIVGTGQCLVAAKLV